MKRVLVLVAAFLISPLAYAEEKPIIAFDAGQALLGGAFDNEVYIFSYEKPFATPSGANTSLRLFLTTGMRCPNFCWDITYVGAELRMYNGEYSNSSYFGYDVFVGSDEEYGFVAGVDVSMGYAMRRGGWVFDPYFRAGTVGIALGMNIGKPI